MRHHGHHHGHPMSTTMGTLCAPRGHHHHAPSLRQTVPVHALRRALQSLPLSPHQALLPAVPGQAPEPRALRH